LRYFLLVCALFLTASLEATKTGLPIPRFVSLRSAEVNVRVGPGLHYPLRWQLIKREPVEVIAEFNNWRKIRCQDGAEGWVHQSMLSGKRLGKIVKETTLRDGSFDKARSLAHVKPNVVVDLRKCKGKWCEIKIGKLKGWVPKHTIWGIYDYEENF